MLSRREFLAATAGLAAGALVPACRSRRLAPATGATSAERAVSAARAYAGGTLNVGWESGPQAEDLLRFSGPWWERLTGIRINVVEMGRPAEQYNRIQAEHRAASGALDCASVTPAWLPDLVAAGALEPLEEYIAAWMAPGDLDDYLPLYRALGVWNGRRYGLFDDGDVLLLYYRRDLFGDAATQRAFAARHGRPLGDPRTYDWGQVVEAARFFTERHAPRLYGMAPFQREMAWSWFQTMLRSTGGALFDETTMRPGVNSEAGRRALANLLELSKAMPPSGAEFKAWTPLTTYLTGNAAMAVFWPPLGRWAEGYGRDAIEVRGIPPSRVAGKTGYALLPGRTTPMATGFMLSVLKGASRPEPAYLFAQWLTSPEVSLQRVMLPFALRDPYRRSHIASKAFRAKWPSAPGYLDALEAGAEAALLDLAIPGVVEYEQAFYLTLTDLRMGVSPGQALDRLAAAWDAITDAHGRERQRAAYAAFLRQPGATPRGGQR